MIAQQKSDEVALVAVYVYVLLAHVLAVVLRLEVDRVYVKIPVEILELVLVCAIELVDGLMILFWILLQLLFENESFEILILVWIDELQFLLREIVHDFLVESFVIAVVVSVKSGEWHIHHILWEVASHLQVELGFVPIQVYKDHLGKPLRLRPDIVLYS